MSVDRWLILATDDEKAEAQQSQDDAWLHSSGIEWLDFGDINDDMSTQEPFKGELALDHYNELKELHGKTQSLEEWAYIADFIKPDKKIYWLYN